MLDQIPSNSRGVNQSNITVRGEGDEVMKVQVYTKTRFDKVQKLMFWHPPSPAVPEEDIPESQTLILKKGMASEMISSGASPTYRDLKVWYNISSISYIRIFC